MLITASHESYADHFELTPIWFDVNLQVLPTNGTKSSSLWDADDKLALQEWLDEFLDADCNSEVFEVICITLLKARRGNIEWEALYE